MKMLVTLANFIVDNRSWETSMLDPDNKDLAARLRKEPGQILLAMATERQFS